MPVFEMIGAAAVISGNRDGTLLGCGICGGWISNADGTASAPGTAVVPLGDGGTASGVLGAGVLEVPGVPGVLVLGVPGVLGVLGVPDECAEE